MHKAIKRMKPQKSADERGLVAELLKHAPDIFIAKLVDGFNDLMSSGEVLHEWRKNTFQNVAKKTFVQEFLQIIGPLQAYDYFSKYLHT